MLKALLFVIIVSVIGIGIYSIYRNTKNLTNS